MKKKQTINLEIYKRRGNWGLINPVSKIVENKKKKVNKNQCPKRDADFYLFKTKIYRNDNNKLTFSI
jgi:hypothetical protein